MRKRQHACVLPFVCLTGIATAFVLYNRARGVRKSTPDTVVIRFGDNRCGTLQTADDAFDDAHTHRLLGLGVAMRASQSGRQDRHRDLRHERSVISYQLSVISYQLSVLESTVSDFYSSHGSINGTPVSRKSRVLRVTKVRRWWSAVAAIILSMAGSVRPARSQVMVSVAHVTMT